MPCTINWSAMEYEAVEATEWLIYTELQCLIFILDKVVFQSGRDEVKQQGRFIAIEACVAVHK